MTGYVIISLMHILSVLAFQQTGIEYFMILPAVHGLYASLILMIASSFMLSNIEEVDYKPETENIGIRLLAQLSMLITAYQLYSIGYIFVAGILTFTGITLIMIIFYIKIGKEKTNE